MRIVRTTDGRHLGKDLASVNIGDSIDLAGFLFEVQEIKTLENGNLLLSNFNYQLECED
jgi:hypothetical protein